MKNKWERARRAGLKPRAPFHFAFRAVLFRFFLFHLPFFSVSSAAGVRARSPARLGPDAAL